MAWIIELKTGVYLVGVHGGVEHTRKRCKAKVFRTELGARISIGGARKYDGWKHGAKVVEIGEKKGRAT